MYIKLILASPASTIQLNSTFKLKKFQLIEMFTKINFNSNKFQIKNVTNWIPDSCASTVPQLNPTFKLKKFSTQINYLKRFKIKSEKLQLQEISTQRNLNQKWNKLIKRTGLPCIHHSAQPHFQIKGRKKFWNTWIEFFTA